MKRVIEIGEDFPILPQDIATDKHMYDAFGHHETEVSAHWIIRFYREARNGNEWAPFTAGEIHALYESTYFQFNGLREYKDEPRSLIQKRGNLYFVTAEFVCRCFIANGIPRKVGEEVRA